MNITHSETYMSIKISAENALFCHKILALIYVSNLCHTVPANLSLPCFPTSVKMATTGRAETQALKNNLQAQLDRLLTQMEDLEELRDEIDADEYEELRDDTAAQLMVCAAADNGSQS